MTAKRVLAALAVAIASALIICGIIRANRYALSDQELIDQAFRNLMADSTLCSSATRGLTVASTQITPSTLAGGVLAQTTVEADGSWRICVDVEDVRRCSDRLEPVIAHELFHVLQATTFGTPGEFIAQVAREKAVKDWTHRSFEIEAVAWEDKVRVELREKNPGAYRTMPATRAATNRRWEATQS